MSLDSDRFKYTCQECTDERAVYSVELPAAATDKLLDFSCDENIDDHLSSGGGLLQGLAPLIALGTCISKWKKGMGPTNLDTIDFECPSLVGDTLEITLEIVEEGRRPTIAYTVLNSTAGVQVVHSTCTLASTKVLARIARSQRQKLAG